MFILSYDSFVNDKKIIDKLDKDALKIRLFDMYDNKFDYLHGLWLIPTGIFIVFLLIILELPDFKNIYKIIIKDLKEKKKEIKLENIFNLFFTCF